MRRSALSAALASLRSLSVPGLTRSPPTRLAAMSCLPAEVMVLGTRYWSALGPLPPVRNRMAASRGRRSGAVSSGVRQRLSRAMTRQHKLDLKTDWIAGNGRDITQSNQGKRHERSGCVPHPTMQASAHCPSRLPRNLRENPPEHAGRHSPAFVPNATTTRRAARVFPKLNQAKRWEISRLVEVPPPVLARIPVSLR